MNTYDALNRYLRPYRRRLVAALAATGCFTLLSLVQPLIMRHLIDGVVRPGRWEALPATVFAILLAPLTAAVVRVFNVHVIVLTARRFIMHTRLLMYRRLLRLSLRYHGANSAGALSGRLMDDIGRLQRLLTAESLQMVVDLIVFLFAVSVLFTLSWKLASVVLFTLVLYALAYRVFSGRISAANMAYRGVFDRISGRLQETLAGVRHVRIYDTDDREGELFRSRTAEGLDRLMDSSMSSTTLGTVCSAIAGYGSTVVCGLGACLVLKGEITYGDLYAIDNYLWMAVNPIIRLTTISAQLAETFVSMKRVTEVLQEPVEIASRPGAPALRTPRGAVDFDNVSFSYDPSRPLFKDLTLRVEPGKMVALAGHTGCGKTTMTSLLMRYWDVKGGSVRIDGADVRDFDLASLRGRFGVVLQQPVLFEGTVAENISYGRAGASPAEIEEAARMAEIYETVARLPKGFDTIIGAGGVKMSLGEKQRVSLARAILRNPTFFIMDEATSALDSESEALIQKALRRALEGRTSFIVAHRLSTVVRADMIVVMDHGRIVETGTHAELSAKAGSVYESYCQHLRGTPGKAGK